MCLPARSSICLGQAMSGNNSRNLDRAGGKGRDRARAIRHDALLTHRIEADGARRELGPDGCSGPTARYVRREPARGGRHTGRRARRWRRACTTSVTPCRVSAIRVAEGIERVFDDVVPGRADDVQKKLTTEFRQAEALAYLAAVENDGARRGVATLAPFGQHAAIIRRTTSSSR